MLTVVYAVYTVGVVAAVFLIGLLSDSVGRKLVLLPAIGVMAAGLIACMFAPNVTVLIIGWVLQGIAIGAGTTTAVAPPARRAEVFSGYQLGLYLGATVPSLLVGFGAAIIGFHNATVGFVFVVLVLAVTGIVCITSTRDKMVCARERYGGLNRIPDIVSVRTK